MLNAPLRGLLKRTARLCGYDVHRFAAAGCSFAPSANPLIAPSASKSSSCSNLIQLPTQASIALFVFSTWPRPRWFSTIRTRGSLRAYSDRVAQLLPSGPSLRSFIVTDHQFPVAKVLTQHAVVSPANRVRAAEGWDGYRNERALPRNMAGMGLAGWRKAPFLSPSRL
jgi:hypothetical protein